jgi:hypothetical protein
MYMKKSGVIDACTHYPAVTIKNYPAKSLSIVLSAATNHIYRQEDRGYFSHIKMVQHRTLFTSKGVDAPKAAIFHTLSIWPFVLLYRVRLVPKCMAWSLLPF